LKVPKQKLREGLRSSYDKTAIDCPIPTSLLLDDIEKLIVKKIPPNMLTGKVINCHERYYYSITPYEENYRSLRS